MKTVRCFDLNSKDCIIQIYYPQIFSGLWIFVYMGTELYETNSGGLKMKRKFFTKKLLALLLMCAMIFSSLPVNAWAAEDETPQNNAVTVNVDFTAQGDGLFLIPPQMNVAVSSNLAESYGYTDQVTDGVSALDVLVKAHEIMLEDAFTAETKDEFLVVTGTGWMTKVFGMYPGCGFVLNGGYPNDGTTSEYGGYNGTTVVNQAVADNDRVEFFAYQDSEFYSDSLAWFCQYGTPVDSLTVAPGQSVDLTLKSYMYMAGYLYKDTASMRLAGEATADAQLAWVNIENGESEDIANAVTDEDGNVTVKMPETEGVYYLTAYMSAKEIEAGSNPLVMSLTPITVSKDAPRPEPCALTALSVADFESNPSALELSPAFSGDITEYSVAPVKYQESEFLRMCYVKAVAANKDAVITAEINGVSAQLTSGDNNWKVLSKALQPGKTNKLVVTVAASGAADAETRTYTVNIPMKSDKIDLALPDKVVDYLCINSQYTNGAYGTEPESTLISSVKSLGNFGGYITYYYEDALTDNPNNKYGIDFYVYGNAMSDGGSFAEPGQVYVSEDGKDWYALAGSEHYEKSTVWDYAVTYSKTAEGKTAWQDNQGNSNDGSAESGAWVSAEKYPLNKLIDGDEDITLSGVLLPGADGTVSGSSSANAATVKFGYADYYANGEIGSDVNPYVANPTQSNGFDLAWAVDKNGEPVKFTNGVHYVKIATASNLWAGATGEKSTEITQMNKTVAADAAVGKTSAPAGVTISDGAISKTIKFNENQQVYSMDLGSMRYVSIGVDGAAADDNIYINNQRIANNGSAAVQVSKEDGERLVRVIVQNGEKEPVIYLLKLTSSATSSDDLIEGVNINVGGSVRQAVTKDGKIYTINVGHRISSVGIAPVVAPGLNLTINNAAKQDSYELAYGENRFDIAVANDTGKAEAVQLVITRDKAPTVSGKNINVSFTLVGDEKHGHDGAVHIYKNDKSKMPVWIQATSYTVPAEATVLDVFEMALDKAGLSYENPQGSYITAINGLGELDNGSKSGWKYMVNGKYPERTLAEQTLKNGDKIIFHYTDDWTQEEDAANQGGGSGGTTADKPADDNKVQPADGNGFTDTKNHWAADAINFVVTENLFTGTTEKTFEPETAMNRAMLVTVLWRLDGKPAAADSNFTDLVDGAYYEPAVAWAAANGIVKGYTDTRFAPNDKVTREQMAAILCRYAEYKGYDISGKADLSGFVDNSQISAYAVDNLKWANAVGLMNGRTETTLAPRGDSTRAEVATMIQRFINNVKKSN